MEREQAKIDLIKIAFGKALPNAEAMIRTGKGTQEEVFIAQAMYGAFKEGFSAGETYMAVKALDVIQRLK